MVGLRTLMRLLLILASIPVAEARFRHYKWEVNYEYKSPDVYKKLMITINGRSPGPTIMAQQNDTIIVQVKNSLLTENVAIHWHGIRQIGTPWFDRAEGVTQCPIVPGDTFVYKYVVDRPGTFLYHGHYGMQRVAGLYGSIRVALPDGESEPFFYDYDRSIILQDWYHKSTYEQATGLSSIPFGWVGEPQSLLIQGRGRFDCSTPSIEAGLCNATNPECSPYVITVVPGKTYRPRTSSTVVSRDRTTPNGLAIFNYYPNHPRKSPPTVPPPGPAWNDSAPRVAQSFAIKARHGYIYPPPQTSDRVIVLLNAQNMFNGYYRWSVNNVSYNFPHTPYLIALKENLKHVFDRTPPATGYDSLNSVVDIVLQNADSLKNHTSETHPWHLYGHDFWVMGYGLGKFNMVNDPNKYNLVDPIMKNTVPVHPYGWTALRFRANNPGVWAFHCHIECHCYMGMGVVFEEGIEMVGKLPTSIMGCGDTRGFHRP
ncbi:L-ascorbate oxidase [Camellia lanceoleosa]|uniref:L-ascorbate oxidase n=1 Tax=Camellia lanceoleosa TaxID=1840588 RepID=A0ACC0ISX6_9ERIC|nr:L-ascorbate oxidase [Camellia lanceoleosa]